MEESPEYTVTAAAQRRPNKRPRVLVACQRCKSRRQKCDNASPECSNCSRAKVSCIYSENAYPSSYVKRMEERVRQLEARLSVSEQGFERELLDHDPNSPELFNPRRQPQSGSPYPTVEKHPDRVPGLAHGLGLLSSCAAAEPHYFGFSAGLSLAHFVQVAIDSGSSSADVSLPLLADRPFSNQALNANATLAKLPSFRTGASYMRAYLSIVHPLYPFLDRSTVWKLHKSLTRQEEQLAAVIPQIDIALMHLVYAIGSRCLQLLGKIDASKNVPEGHFLSAMKAVSEDLKFTSIRSIEVTLLLAIHSMRSPSGTSVWHLSGLAIRQCLELGLHKQRMVDSRNVQLDQHRKRLFWSAYIFERKTALVLGRPFALSDEEIDLDLPMSVDDDEEEERNLISALGMEPLLQQTERTILSYHCLHVELYQIHTEIRLALHRMKKTSTKEQAQQMMSALFEKLEDWRTKVLNTYDARPQRVLPASRSRDTNRRREPGDSGSGVSGSEQEIQHRPIEVEKSELLLEYHKARRSLLQPLMTEGRQNFPFDTADFTACAEASGQICQLYRRLHRLSPTPFSLRDLHAVFVAGFTLIYCVCTCPSIYSAQRVGDVGACSTVLYVISEQWSSAKKYRDAFEVVAEKMMESTKKYQETGSLNYLDPQPSGALSTATRAWKRPSSGESNAVSEGTSSGAGAQNGDETLSSDTVNGFIEDSRLQTTSYNTAILPETGDELSYQHDAHVTMWHTGLELDLNLEYDIYGIEGLLSNEGLDWFTGAVL